MITEMSPSPWIAAEDEVSAPLRDERDVDAAIIGAGYTGLASALALRQEGLDVAVLEAEFAGFGASGRNAGHLTPTIGKDLPTLARIFGRQRARALVALAETAIGHVEQLIERYDIACDYAPVGNVVAAVHPRQHAALDRAARAAADLGAKGQLLEPGEMRSRGLPRAFTRGFFEPRGGILHPGRYVRGLRRAVLAAGATLFEHTPVVRIEQAPRIVLHTAGGGRVRARHLVMATNAYTPALGLPRATVLPVWVQLFQTAPLTDHQRAAVGWHGGEGIYTAHEMLESYRLTAEGRIVGGAKHVRYGYGGRSLLDADPAVAARLETVFRQRFPELHGLEITQHWGGPIAFALDFLPVLGRTGSHRNVVYALGYAGHGVALASYAGRMVADLVLERQGPGAVLSNRRTIRLPPEPLRWLVVHGLTATFGVIDRRVDAAAAASAGTPAKRGRAVPM